MGPTVWSHENRVSKEGMAGNERQSQVRNPVLARTVHCIISAKIYPSACYCYTLYQFMGEMYWLTVHLLYM